VNIFLGELLGTAALILFGNGVVAGALLKASKAENAGWMAITAGWAFAVFVGIVVAKACGSAAAYLNPAFAIGMAVRHGDWTGIPQAIAGELLGAMLGAALVFLHYLPHWRGTADPAIKRAAFCTAPAVRDIRANLVSEIIGTFALTFAIGAMLSPAVAPHGLADGVGPYLVAVIVWAIGLSLGGTTGYAINPARDLGPRIAHALLPIPGKGDSDWRYAPVPVLGPVIGAALAGLALSRIGA
jgi:glycerol uptake facilitator protein